MIQMQNTFSIIHTLIKRNCNLKSRAQLIDYYLKIIEENKEEISEKYNQQEVSHSTDRIQRSNYAVRHEIKKMMASFNTFVMIFFKLQKHDFETDAMRKGKEMKMIATINDERVCQKIHFKDNQERKEQDSDTLIID